MPEQLTVAARAAWALALMAVGIRIATLIQMLPSLPRAVEISERPALTVISWSLAIAAAVITSGWCLLRHRPLPPSWFAIDAGLAVLLLLTGPFTVPQDHLIGSWVGFQSANALAVMLSGSAVRDARIWWAAVVSLPVSQIVFVWSAIDSSNWTTALGNVLTLILLAPVARVGTSSVQRIAADADEAKAEAAHLAREGEERRARLAMHNGTAVMRLLAEPDLDEETHRRLQEQAVIEVRRMRTYLTGDADRSVAPATHPDGVSLVDLVARVSRGFPDLAPVTALDLAQGVRITEHERRALDVALASLLHNVRQHAGATRVVLHADHEPTTHEWVLTVHDDGIGFAADPATYGVGLGQLVISELAEHRIETEVESLAGLGTTITLRGHDRHAARSASAQHQGEA